MDKSTESKQIPSEELAPPPAKTKMSLLAPTIGSVNFDGTRQHITSIYDRYYLTVGLLTSEWETKLGKQKFIGTGTMIAPNLVITAAHNLRKSKKLEGLPKLLNINFSPGITSLNPTQPISIGIKEVLIHPSYNYPESEFDLAILLLEESIGLKSGFIPYQAMDEKSTLDQLVTITGYPGEFKERERLKALAKEQFSNLKLDADYIPFMMRKSGKIEAVEKDILKYKINTSTGQSGSVIVRKSKRGQYVIIGIHSAKLNFKEFNVGCRLTPDKVKWINETKMMFTSSYDLKKELSNRIEDILNKINASYDDPDTALVIGMSYLNTFEFNNISEFITTAEKILIELEKIFPSSCKAINRYLTIADKMNQIFIQNAIDEFSNELLEEEEEYKIFTSFNTKVASKYKENWRVVRKIFLHKNIFSSLEEIFGTNLEEKRQWLAEKIFIEIENAKESIIWQENHKNHEVSINFSLSILDRLSLIYKYPQGKELLLDSIIDGKIAKKSFGLPCSLVIGDDGGFFAMLNSIEDVKMPEEIRISYELIENILKENNIDVQYLNEKLTPKKKNEQVFKREILIGKGSFGKVRLALSLFDTENTYLAGRLICTKKYGKLGSNIHMQAKMIEFVINEYFSNYNKASRIVYSPKMFDISSHLEKGYLFMALIPRNTGAFIFQSVNQHNDQFKVTFLIDVLRKILELLDQNVVFTDLKPENILFDTENFDVNLIDLGGAIQVEDTQNFDLYSHNQTNDYIQYTKEFSSPELLAHLMSRSKSSLDLRKSLSYSFGKLIEFTLKSRSSIQNQATHQTEIARKTDNRNSTKPKSIIDAGLDFFGKLFKSEIKIENIPPTTSEVKADLLLKEITSLLTIEDPKVRSSLEQALEMLNKINETASEVKNITTDFIFKLSRKIKASPSSLEINPDIFIIKEWFIPQNVSHLDPNIFPNLDTEDLESKLNSLLDKDQKVVFLLLGNAGSGKSTYLQQKFIAAVQDWKFGMPIPLYFNLASNINIKTVVENIDNLLNSNLRSLLLKPADDKVKVNLFIDSFDEATFDEMVKPENLFPHIIDSLKGAEIQKIILTCRSDFKPLEDDWFQFNANRLETSVLKKLYIVPLDYTGDQNLNKYIQKYIDMNKIALSISDCYNKIRRLSLATYLTTGLMFSIIMKT